jgi:hypothetical protein
MIKYNCKLFYLNAFPAKNFKFSSVSPLPQEALNFMLSVLATWLKKAFSNWSDTLTKEIQIVNVPEAMELSLEL